MAPTSRKGKGKGKEIAPSPPSGRDKNRKTHSVERKSMKLKRKHPLELAIKPEGVATSSGRKYSVSIGEGGDFISTFAATEGAIRSWLKEILKTYSKLIRTASLKVGVALDCNKKEGRSADTPYTHMTLCTGSHSLTVFLMGEALCKPLLDFLQTNDAVTFTGIEMNSKQEKLQRDYGIHLKNVVDVLPLARNVCKGKLERGTIEEVAAAVLGEEYAVPKPDQVRLSDPDQPALSTEQIKYAVFEAYLGLRLAEVLLDQ